MRSSFFLISLLFFLVFSGCTGSPENDASSQSATESLFLGASVLTKPNFSLVLPATWREFPVSEIGRESRAIAAFRRIEPITGGYPNIVFHEENIPKDFSTLEFFAISRNNEEASLLGFQKISEDHHTLSGSPAILFQFSSQPEADKSEYRYWQLFFVRNGKGIVATGSAPKETEKEVIFEIESILKNIRIL